MPSNPYKSLVESTHNFPNKVIFDDNALKKYTYFEFLQMVNRYAQLLKDRYKIKKGNHVGLLLYDTIDFPLNFYALAKLGAVCIPFPTKYRENEVRELIEKSDLDLLVHEGKFKPWVIDYQFDKIEAITDFKYHGLEYLNLDAYSAKDYESAGELNDEIIITFTSGTTSSSKGVILKNHNVMHAIISYHRILEIKQNDRTVIPIPIYHITGLVALMGLFVYAGATTFLQRKFDTMRLLKCIEDEKITFMHASPTVFIKMMEFKEDYPELRSLRYCGCGSSYMPVEKMNEFHKWLPYVKFSVIYGMTETASPALICPNDSPTSIYSSAAGKPIPGLELKIVAESGHECPQGEVGLLHLRGANITAQYYHQKLKDIDDDFWLNTGDLAFFNEDNYVFIVDRKKDMINHGGEKIWTRDVEEAICSIPGVNECAVVGIKNELYGEVAAAVVVPVKDVILSETMIKNALIDKLAKYKIPEKILILDEIYRTRGMKVDKKRIRKLFE